MRFQLFILALFASTTLAQQPSAPVTLDAGIEIAIDPEASVAPVAPAIPEVTAQPVSDIPPKLLLTEVQSQPLAQAA